MICSENSREPSGGANLSVKACRSWAPRGLLVSCASVDATLERWLAGILCARNRASYQLRKTQSCALRTVGRGQVRGGPSTGLPSREKA